MSRDARHCRCLSPLSVSRHACLPPFPCRPPGWARCWSLLSTHLCVVVFINPSIDRSTSMVPHYCWWYITQQLPSGLLRLVVHFTVTCACPRCLSRCASVSMIRLGKCEYMARSTFFNTFVVCLCVHLSGSSCRLDATCVYVYVYMYVCNVDGTSCYRCSRYVRHRWRGCRGVVCIHVAVITFVRSPCLVSCLPQFFSLSPTLRSVLLPILLVLCM